MKEEKITVSRSKTTGPAMYSCPGCGVEHSRASWEQRKYICPECRRLLPMPWQARIAMLVDAGSFQELDRKMVSIDPLRFTDLKSYRERLKEARRETGAREAVTTGLCLMGGQRVVLVVFDFRFLGGTMGSVVGEKIANAFEEAIRRRVPVVSVSASGG